MNRDQRELTQFARLAHSYKVLPADQQRELALRAQAGDTGARDKLANSSLGLVLHGVYKWRNQWRGDEDDMVAVGMRQLIDAIAKYRAADADCMFSTYAAAVIRYGIMKYLAYRDIPRGYRHYRYRDEMPEIEMVSIDSTGTTDTDATIADTLAADFDIDERLMREWFANEVGAAIEELPLRDQNIMILRYGLDGYEPATLEAIGGLFNISKQRVQQIEAASLSKLRELPRLKQAVKERYAV